MNKQTNNMDTIQESVSSLYLQIVGKPIDGKLLAYYTNVITKGEKCLQDIEKALVCTDEYRSKALNLFKEVYYEQLNSIPDQTIFSDFWKSNSGHTVTYASLLSFIKSLPQYREHYSNIIRTTFKSLTTLDCSEDVVGFYLDHYISNDTYSLEDLFKGIASNLHQSIINKSNVKEEIVDDVKDIVIEEKKRQQVTVQESPDNIAKTVELQWKLLHEFETEFGRNIFVPEYFKYIIADQSLSAFKKLSQLKEAHISNFNKVRTIVYNYTLERLTEWSYVNNFLFDVDKPAFIENYIDNIIKSTEYKASMIDTLRKLYQDIFDLQLDTNDLEYVFVKVQQARKSVTDESLNDTLKDLKAETDKYVEHIFSVFKDVLEREPELFEVNEHLEVYRKTVPISSIEAVDTLLEKTLLNTLEFHDVLKKYIKDTYLSVFKNDISHAKLFSYLQQCLTKIDEVRIREINVFLKSIIV